MRPADYAVLLLYLLAVTWLGLAFRKQQRSTRDYFLGGRAIPSWALCLSIVATETSTLTFIGAPALAYSSNMAFLQLAAGYVVGRVAAALLLLPGYFRGELLTAYDVIHRRFGPRLHRATALLFLVTRSLADGVRLHATALVLTITGGMDERLALVLVGAVTLLYTFQGGLAAVIWTDVAQFVLYMGGALLVLVELLQRIPGGLSGALRMAEPLGKLRVVDPTASLSAPYTLWAGIVGGAFLSMASHGTDQLIVQRLLAARSQRGGRWALVGSGVVVFAQFALFLFLGVLLFAYYKLVRPARSFARPDEVLPAFIGEALPVGLVGLVVAAIFAAAMSTLSGSLSSLASATLADVYIPYVRPHAAEGHYLRAGRWFTLLWGVVLIGIARLAKGWGSVLEVGLTIASFTYGALLGVFLLGTLTRRVGEGAALAGMAAGLGAMAVVRMATSLAWTWYVPVGTAITVGVGLLVARRGSGWREGEEGGPGTRGGIR